MIQGEDTQTGRNTSPQLDKILHQQHNVLDHGFIRVVDYMGNDSSIVQAARVSYGSGTKKVNEDKGLINYLMSHRHNTPFEMCEIKFHVKLPIFVARQWIRHRSSSYNEYSARYSMMEDEFYIPEISDISPQSSSNHQGRNIGEKISVEEAQNAIDVFSQDSAKCYQHYLDLINNDKEGNTFDNSKAGIARELARINLPVNCYTQWYWKINLHNLFNFISLRIDSHAQYEIRKYAEVIYDIVKKWVPYASEAFEKHRLNAKNFSGPALEVIKKMANGDNIDEESSGLNKREWKELTEFFNK
jgi:thymidylate synthase (FAD)